MRDSEVYRSVRSHLVRRKLTILKEDPPRALTFMKRGMKVDIHHARRYLLDPAAGRKYVVDVEGYVRFRYGADTVSLEWDVRPSVRLSTRLERERRRLTLLTAYVTLAVVGTVAGILLTPMLMRDPLHAFGYVAFAVMFLWIPPLTTYTLLEHIHSSLLHLGSKNAGTRISETFGRLAEMMPDVRIARFEG